MTIGDIISKIKKFYPKAASWSNDDIIGIINDEQKEIFREIQNKDMYEFDTVADQLSYQLPDNCSIEFIEFVGISEDSIVSADSIFSEYTFTDINQNLTGLKYFDALNGLIGIYPIPEKSGLSARVIFRKKPTTLTSSNLNAVPDLKEDWHRILVYGGIIAIAGSGSNPDIATVNNYTMQYNSLMRDIMQSRYERNPKYPSTKDVMKKGQYSRNYGKRNSYIRTPYN